jgi:formiminotetrahydrofolate cyclodeaminase
MYINSPIKKYLNDLGAKLPAPGGGSAAAMGGALGTALLEMVCNFTVGNERYKDVEEDIKRHIISLKKIRDDFSLLIDGDVNAYTAIRAAFRTKDEKNIDKALKEGYYISLNICKLSRDGLCIAQDVSCKGNKNLITDVGCGAGLLKAVFDCGVFNCEINLNGIKDKDFVKGQRIELENLLRDVDTYYTNAISRTRERMG